MSQVPRRSGHRRRLSGALLVLAVAASTSTPAIAATPALKPTQTVAQRCGDPNVMIGGPDHTLWLRAGGYGTICRVTGGKVQGLTMPSISGQTYGYSLVRSPSGQLWFDYQRLGPGRASTAYAGVARINPADMTATPFPLPESLLQQRVILQALYPVAGPGLELALTIVGDKNPFKQAIPPSVVRIAPDGSASAPGPPKSLFPGAPAKRLVSFAPDGSVWAAIPGKHQFMRAAFGSAPLRTYPAPAAVTQAKWMAVGAGGTVWIGGTRQATAWKRGSKPRTIRFPRHPGLHVGSTAVTSNGRLAISFIARPGRGHAAPQAAYLLGADGSRRPLDLRGNRPGLMAVIGHDLWLAGTRKLLRYAI